MSTKDQAIAPTKELLALGAFLGAMHDCKQDGAEMRKAMLQTLGIASPNCRTCTDYDRLEGCLRAPRYGVCTNGDQYQPAPAVVLWRTE